jgi:two-component system, OmpR family, response regulator
MHRILVVDDDPHIRDVICFALEKAGMTTDSARNGSEALRQVELRAPSLIVLDIGMPEMDGLEVCRRLRKSSDIPILFLSARDEEIDRVLGLEIGGDDYVTKPFSPRELVARVNVILRRSQAGSMGEPREEPPRSHGQLTLDPGRHLAAIGGKELGLTAVEFSILSAMTARPSLVFTREQLMSAAYHGKVHVSDRTIDSHIRNIRAKSAAIGCGNAVETVHGVGFRLGLCEPGR